MTSPEIDRHPRQAPNFCQMASCEAQSSSHPFDILKMQFRLDRRTNQSDAFRFQLESCGSVCRTGGDSAADLHTALRAAERLKLLQQLSKRGEIWSTTLRLPLLKYQ